MTEYDGRPTVGALSTKPLAPIEAACMLSQVVKVGGQALISQQQPMLVMASQWQFL